MPGVSRPSPDAGRAGTDLTHRATAPGSGGGRDGEGTELSADGPRLSGPAPQEGGQPESVKMLLSDWMGPRGRDGPPPSARQVRRAVPSKQTTPITS